MQREREKSVEDPLEARDFKYARKKFEINKKINIQSKREKERKKEKTNGGSTHTQLIVLLLG